MMYSAALPSWAALLILTVGSRHSVGTKDRSISNPFLMVPFLFLSAFVGCLSSTSTRDVELPTVIKYGEMWLLSVPFGT